MPPLAITRALRDGMRATQQRRQRGHMENGESPQDALYRELREERSGVSTLWALAITRHSNYQLLGPVHFFPECG